MLTSFFKLNGKPRELLKQEDLISHLEISNDVRNVLYIPDTLSVRTSNASNPFVKKSFNNVSFSQTTVTGAIFRECKFEDCLFVGTSFVNCEFHKCSFKGCNPHRVTFENTYIDPSVFEGMLDPVKYSNIGMRLFQHLYDNSMDMRQREFANSAEFNRSKWKRYVLNHEYRGWNKMKPRYWVEWIANYSFYAIAGYGIRARFIFAWAFVVMFMSLGINYCYWQSFNVLGKNGAVSEREFITVLYYTATIPYGVGELTPASSIGRIFFLGEAILGFVILSVFVTWLVKRALR